MNAITLPKNPPSATMGIKTSSSPIRSSRPRSLALSHPLDLAALSEQALGEIEPLLGFRQPTLELVDLGDQLCRVASEHDAVLRGLHGHPLVVRLRPPTDPLRERLPHRPREDDRGTDDERETDHSDCRDPHSHATVSSSWRTYRPSPPPPAPCASLGR